MANHIQVSLSQSIVTLYTRGWKKLRIARELGVDTRRCAATSGSTRQTPYFRPPANRPLQGRKANQTP